MKKSRQHTLIITTTTIVIILLFSLAGLSQSKYNFETGQQASNWVFGEGSMIKFTNGQAIPCFIPEEVFIPNGVSSISSVTGQLLLFSDGQSVMNSMFETLENGIDLSGNNLASQSSIIIPQPGSNSRFYLFTVDLNVPPLYVDGINYSIIEITDDGEEVLVSKNNLLLTDNAQKITAVKHSNGIDYWVVVHGFGEEKGGDFYSYLLTGSMLDTVPVVTTIGHPHNGNGLSNNQAGSMKISPDGSKLALVIPEDGIVELYDFNTSTGAVSNLKTSEFGEYPYSLGIEFSPDASKLYFTISPELAGISLLYQLDLNQDDPFANPFIVHQFEIAPSGTADSVFGALQLAPDGRIYVAKFRRELRPKGNLGVIYNPDMPGVSCNYNYLDNQSNNGLFLNGGGSLIGLPNFVSSFLNISHFYYSGNCYKDSTKFVIRNTANIDGVNWDFGGAVGELVDDNQLSPKFIYDEPGIYEVNLTEHYGKEDYYFTQKTSIYPLPNVQIAGPDTLYMSENSTMTLDAGEWDSYNWQPGGSKERYLDVTKEGVYTVSVSDSNCCSNSDSVQVLFISSTNEFNSIAEKITISPNPSNGEFKIYLKNPSEKSKVNIYSMDGRLVFTQDINDIETTISTDLSPASYIVQVLPENENFTVVIK